MNVKVMGVMFISATVLWIGFSLVFNGQATWTQCSLWALLPIVVGVPFLWEKPGDSRWYYAFTALWVAVSIPCLLHTFSWWTGISKGSHLWTPLGLGIGIAILVVWVVLPYVRLCRT